MNMHRIGLDFTD